MQSPPGGGGQGGGPPWGGAPGQGAWGQPQAPQQGGWGAPPQAQQPAAGQGAWGQPQQAQPQQGAWGQPQQAQPQQGAWGQPQAQPQQQAGWGQPQQAQPPQQGGWGAQPQAPQGYGPPQPAQGAWGGPPPPGQPAQAWGAPQAAMVPAGPAAMMGGAGAVMGVALEPGEHVVYFHRPSYTVNKAVFWIVGLLLVWVLIGIIFIVMALLVDGRNPRAQIVTNRRVIWIDGKGNPSQFPLAEAVDVDVERQRAQSHGQGLIGLAVSAAVNAVANSIANQNAKIDRKFWARGVAVILIGRSGQRFRVESRDAQGLGPVVARAVLEPGSADRMPPAPVTA